MELNSWNRKDVDPISTIRKFKGILESVGIKLQIIREEKYKEFWYSNRIEVCDLTTIGTNGKGNISVQGATNDIKKCFRYAEWKSQIFHSIFTYSLVALIDEIKPSVAFLLSSKLIFSQSSR